ncbi:ABC transporter ATP-binding protein [Alloyangia pacifica]|uniref:Multiple sugar transport system ATP-binding protein n=1 Tax=Alloyangia pacifica TaxID=311180 RepID=A0A1I6UXM0_9RHOB|nr:ABC transporter ATP-binding protein [Alloyangia pacifica]SDI29780.1 multiple sugar transport system ATP-binding protein [Alloyangia pacifica]SFT06168.1 multiple sugar transport system ATP-binding protein [Alloyangia pacifica]
MSSITIQNVSKAYGDTKVLHSLNLDIHEGEFVSLLGPSGCGKSTLLFCVAGLEEITDGQILFDGQDIAARNPRDRNIALVFQDYALYPHMSVRENIAFPLRRQKIDAETIHGQVNWAADMLGLTKLLDRSPAELSGGQRQRVAVGRAVVRNPAALLMDEPLSNLDASLRVHMRTEIKRLARELGLTVLFVTHDQEEAMVMSDRIAVLAGGHLQQFADPMTIYRKPSNRFVAEFIGSPTMNMLPDAGHPGAVTLGVRPHDLTLGGSGGFSLDGRLTLIEPAGPHYFLDVEIGGAMIKATASDIDGLAPGAEVTLRAEDHRVYRFDSTSGAAI